MPETARAGPRLAAGAAGSAGAAHTRLGGGLRDGLIFIVQVQEVGGEAGGRGGLVGQVGVLRGHLGGGSGGTGGGQARRGRHAGPIEADVVPLVLVAARVQKAGV